MNEKNNYKELAEKIVEYVGGKENVISCMNCMTRLRFKLKDETKIDVKALENLPEVAGVTEKGNIFMVIIGQAVPSVYECVAQIIGNDKGPANGENAQKDIALAESSAPAKKEKLTLKKAGSNILGYITQSIAGIVPLILVGGLSKTFALLLGPTMLNLISDTSDLYVLLTMFQNVMLYFLPVYLGYTCCKILDVNPVFGIYLGTLLLAPDFLAMVGERSTFNVFGISAPVADYSQTLIPIMLTVFILKYVLQFFKKIIPEVVSTIFVNLFTVFVTTAVMFLICAPLGTVIGNLLTNLLYIAEINAFLRVLICVIIGAVYPYLVASGLHFSMGTLAVLSYVEKGYDALVFSTAFPHQWAIYGLALAAFIRLKDKNKKGEAFGCFLTGILGGITETTIYGIGLNYKRGMLPVVIGSGIGGLICGIFNLKAYVIFGNGNIIGSWAVYLGGTTSNFIIGVVAMMVAFVVALICGLYIPKYNEQ